MAAFEPSRLTSKITGEEDIFSHTDLYDFQANLDGSKAAIASLEKALNERDPQLLINERFEKVQTLLDKYKELSDALDVLLELGGILLGLVGDLPVQIASGAQGLLDEIATSKITGEDVFGNGPEVLELEEPLEGELWWTI